MSKRTSKEGIRSFKLGKISNGLNEQQGIKVRWFWAVAFLLVFIAAAIPRLIELGRGIWAAEAWVANSLLTDSLSKMFLYDAWLQTTPPLFLLLARAMVKVVGASNLTLRLLPFIFGMGAVILTAILAVRLFRYPFAMLCTMLVALAPTAVRYSLELKQYTGDLFVGAAILLALWRYVERRRRAYFWIMVLFTIGVFLSHASIMFIPLAACVLLFADPVRELKRRILICAGFLFLVGLLTGLHYLIFIKQNLVPHLYLYWKDGFLQSFRAGEVALFYVKYFAGLIICFFLPDQSKDLIEKLLISFSATLRLTMFLIVSASVAGFVGAIRRDKRRLWILSFCLVPALTLLSMNLLRLYPMSSRRLLLFMLPCVSVGIVLLLETLWDLISCLWPSSFRRTLSIVSVSFGVVCVLMAFIIGTRPILWHIWETEDVEGAVKYLKLVVREGDVMYAHGTAAESVKLYLRMLEWQEAPIVYGMTGWPCCIPNPEMQLGNSDDDSIRNDVERARAKASQGTLWLMYGYLGGEEATIQLDYLRAKGFSVQQQGSFTRFTLYKVRIKRLLL